MAKATPEDGELFKVRLLRKRDVSRFASRTSRIARLREVGDTRIVEVWRRIRGFSLIELLIVAAIIAILATIAVPLLTPAFRKSSLDAAASDIISTCSAARSRAISGNTFCAVRFDESARKYTTRIYDVDGAVWTDDLNPKELPKTIVFTSGGVSFPSDAAVFDPHGSLRYGGSIEIADAGGVTVKLRGIVASGRIIREGE